MSQVGCKNVLRYLILFWCNLIWNLTFKKRKEERNNKTTNLFPANSVSCLNFSLNGDVKTRCWSFQSCYYKIRGHGSPPVLFILQCQETESIEHILTTAFQDTVYPCEQISTELQTMTSDLTVRPTWSGNKVMLQLLIAIHTMSAFTPQL